MAERFSEAELDAANLQVAWSLAHTMTRAQYDQLCAVTLQRMRRVAGADEANTAEKGATV